MKLFASKSIPNASGRASAASAPAPAPAPAPARPLNGENGGDHHPLPLIASSFTALAARWQSHPDELSVLPLAEACDHISVLFHFLGVAFSFGGKDYIEKVKSLKDASEKFPTLPEMMDADVRNGTVKVQGSFTRNLLRVKRGLELNRKLFEGMLADSSVLLRDVAWASYNDVFAPYHSWPIRQAVAAGMYALPTKAQFLSKLKEDDVSWRKGAKEYVEAVGPVIKRVEDLFEKRKLQIDW